jgi:hypothetical protein
MHPATTAIGALDWWWCLPLGVLGVLMLDARQVYLIHAAQGEFVWEIEKRYLDEARFKRETERGRHLEPSWSESHAFGAWVVAHAMRALVGGVIAAAIGAVGPLNPFAAMMCGITGQLGLDKTGESDPGRRLLVNQPSRTRPGKQAVPAVASEGPINTTGAELGDVKVVGDEA